MTGLFRYSLSEMDLESSSSSGGLNGSAYSKGKCVNQNGIADVPSSGCSSGI